MMGDPDPDPDPLSVFLIPHGETPNLAKSAPPSTLNARPPSDPPPPSPDLQAGGSIRASRPLIVISDLVCEGPPAADGVAPTPQASTGEHGDPMDGRRRAEPPSPVHQAQSHSNSTAQEKQRPHPVCGTVELVQGTEKPSPATMEVQEHSNLPRFAGNGALVPPTPDSGLQGPSLRPLKSGPSVQATCVKQGAAPPNRGDQRHSPLTEDEPPPQVVQSAQSPSLLFNAQMPGSPTSIDSEIQAQASTLLPELAEEVNRARLLKSSGPTEGNPAINPQPGNSHSNTQDISHNPHADLVVQGGLLRSRIPANIKGKRLMRGEGIHEEQPMTSLHQPISYETTGTSPTHNLDAEDGWEPAKVVRRRRKGSGEASAQRTRSTADRQAGSIFFKNKMEGRCFNCFSPNHIAPSCHRSPRCWKCYLSGHRAKDRNPNHRRHQYKERMQMEQGYSTSNREHKTNHRSFAEVVKGEKGKEKEQGSMAVARYPGDPRARPARAYCAVSATGDIRRRRDELIHRAAVCWLPGSSHDTEPHHLGDALRNQLGIHHDDVQILKHFPEQFLVIFNNPRDRQRVVEVGVLRDNGRRFQFARWSELRYADNTSWEFRVKVRIEGVPLHCWAEDVAAKVLGRSCAIHHLEETTRRRQRTRSFDLWAWCRDPCDIPTEVELTVTAPDRDQPLQDAPVDIKRGQVYKLRNHLEVVEDLTFLQEPGRLEGPGNRKARRVFDWDYGVPDSKGEHVHGRRAGHGDRGRDRRPRRDDDDDHDGRGNHGYHRHRSLSAWARNSRCRGGTEDCISSNRWRGGDGSPSHRHRQISGATQKTTQVWKVKEQRKEKKTKRVSFADPIATELKPPRCPITDDSISLIMDKVSTMGADKEKQGAQEGRTVLKPPMMSAEPEGARGTEETRGAAGHNITPKQETDKARLCELETMLGQLQGILHFARPLDKTAMGAIQDLIEQGGVIELKDALDSEPAAPGMEA